ncbi:unnamed protein product [Paramecium sonneborni]|uniref:Uncharacterized protein n=1 Tax=Paramecium sonneborni TaxID=65129 RepID=A0A8S1K3P0_9CILI|nr:unnamed protein product [Paramecium sonneborni]
MFSLSLPKNCFEFQQKNFQNLKMLSNQNEKRENFFQNYIKIRLAKMEIRNLAKTQNKSFRSKTNVIRTQYPIQNGQCQLKNKVRRFVTVQEFSKTDRVTIKKFSNVKRKESENWSDLNQWNYIQDETIQQ